MHTLPDKGAKIKQSIRQIDFLLNTDTMDMDATTTTTAAAAATDVEAPKTTETEQQVEEEQPKDEQVPTEEASPAPKTTLTKRRTIFNPFGKPKKEDQVESDESAENKKKTKGFGAFFSKSKVTPPPQKKIVSCH